MTTNTREVGEMQIHQVEQGSPEWHALRDDDYFTASNAPAMMGASPYKSRPALMAEMKGAAKEPISERQQALFDDGHAAEASARDHLEMETMRDWPALVGTIEIDGLRLLASFDGLILGYRAWEHKLWNKTLVENVRNNVLEPKHYWQLEHQALVAGVDEILFTTSDGTTVNRASMVYESQPERRQAIIDGWKQFAIDLEGFEIEAKQEVIPAQKVEALPAVNYKMDGAMITSNIKDVLVAIQDRAARESNRVLESDTDFASKDEFNKSVKALRASLKEKVEAVQGEFATYADFATTAAEIDKVLQKMQSHGEKQVDKAKADKKAKIKRDGIDAVTAHIQACNARMAPVLIHEITDAAADFDAVMKNKRTIESLETEVNQEVARVKIAMTKATDLVEANLIIMRDLAKDHEFLFNDFRTIVNQASESFTAVVKTRIAEHEAAAKIKADEEREKIRQEEQANAQHKIDADKAIFSFGQITRWATNCDSSGEWEKALADLLEICPSNTSVEIYGDHTKEVMDAYAANKITITDAIEASKPVVEEKQEDAITGFDQAGVESVSHPDESLDAPDAKPRAVSMMGQGHIPVVLSEDFKDALDMFCNRWYLKEQARDELVKLIKQYL